MRDAASDLNAIVEVNVVTKLCTEGIHSETQQ